MGGASVPSVEPSTRERILYEASVLIAAFGYHATTTRDIARAVGIRQPSLFHHFPSKAAIVIALLEWDLNEALPYVRRLAALKDPAAIRLYHYICHDVEHLATAPYNLAGIYAEDVMGDPEFAEWAAERDAIHAAVERIVRQGIETGEFLRVEPDVVRESIAGILTRTLTLHSGGRGVRRNLGDEIAALILRGLLADPSSIDEVRRAADRYGLELSAQPVGYRLSRS
jgi:AcrR family transcriptional regulator